MGKAEKPQIIGIIVCERILQDLLRPDCVSCINIHNAVTAGSFPLVIPQVCVFAQLSGSHHEFTYQVRIVDRLGQIIANSNAQKVDPLPNINFNHKVVSAFTGLTFHEEGLYNIVLAVDGEDAGSLPFQVNYYMP